MLVNNLIETAPRSEYTYMMEANTEINHSSPGPLSVFGYLDYRKYLKDSYEKKKASQRGYSYRHFSKSAGFASPNVLKLVMEGKRNIGPSALEQFIKGLNLKGLQAEYFRALVQWQQATKDEEKEKHFWRLQQLLPHSKKRQLVSEELQYLSHWLYPALRDLCLLKDFRDDPYWMARRLYGDNISVREVAFAWEFLIENGYVSKNTSGRFTPVDQMVASSDEVRSLGVRNYHREMLKKSNEALEGTPLENREFAALTVGVPGNAMAEIKARVKRFRRELHEWLVQLAAEEGVDTVLQINMQVFPHTKRVNK